MALPPTVLPAWPTMTMPDLPNLTLSESELQQISRLTWKLQEAKREISVLDDYYNAEQAMTTLGISLPPELSGLRTVLGWPRTAVDAIHDRLDIDGFRYPESTDADEAMWEIWQRNNLDAEVPLGILDALIHARSHLVVGAGEDRDAPPLVTVESALNLAYEWDARKRAVRSALQLYVDDTDTERAALFLPMQTIELIRDKGTSRWEIDSRDPHNVGWTPVLPMVNRARVHDRYGKSEITSELRSITDAAIRAMLRMEVGAEFFSVPQRYIVGASERDFQDADGNPKTAWETYIGRFLAFERDSEGNVPTLGQFSAGDPSTHVQLLNYYADVVSSITGLPPSYLGKTTDNPASADAIRMSTDRLVQKAKRKQSAFEAALEGAMRAAIAFKSGNIPDQAQMIETIWRPPEIPTPAATSAAIQQQVAAGYLPPTSDVTGEMLGYTPLQRSRIERDRKEAEGDAAIQAIAARAAALPTLPAGPASPAAPRPAQDPAAGPTSGAPASRPPSPRRPSAAAPTNA
jgi:hypothetical protein